MRVWSVGIGAACALLLGVTAWAAPAPVLVSGDEPVVVTEHQVRTASGVLRYEARAGRLAIRNDETGEVRGHIFFVAYMVKSPAGRLRPLTVAWNGGPTTASVLVHTELLGPRRIASAAFVDNAETLLPATDLVFMDPIETGFSRPEKPEFDKEFLSTLGDFAATAEFIRAYRARFAAEKQPLYLLGESYGTWRVSGVAELMAKRGLPVAGAVLISGGIPGSNMPYAFSDAYFVPARTAAAFEHKRLAPDLMADRTAALKASEAWVTDRYLPALMRLADLSDAEREQIAQDLARFTGIPAEMVDRKTLVVSNRAYLAGFFGGDRARTLNTFDMRITGAETSEPGRDAAIADYFRGELGYRTDLAYTGLEDGYMPTPGPARRGTGVRWAYNQVELTPEIMARANSGAGPPGPLPWLQNAMRLDKGLRVFVAAGRFDSLNSCAGNIATAAKAADLAGRISTHCYEGGHMMYRDQPTRRQLSKDLAAFIAGASPRR